MNTPTARLRRVTGALLALVLIGVGAPWATSRVVLAQNQVLFVSVIDGEGEPVMDLTPEELTVQLDGEDCETMNLEPIDWPVRVTVFVDNGETGQTAVRQIRDGLTAFMDVLQEEVEVALWTTGGQAQSRVEHTADRAELTDGIDRIVPDSDAARYMDALIEEAERLGDDEERQYYPVIVMVASDGPDGSRSNQQDYEDAVQLLVDSSATVHTRILVAGGENALAAQVGEHIGTVTRGSHESLAAGSAFVTVLPELAEDIARKHRRVSNQFRVTYAPPDGVSDQPRISIGSSRSGLSMIPTVDGNVP